ncbi:MAG: serine/threonine-protein kinase [Kofleriaceae bacterium]
MQGGPRWLDVQSGAGLSFDELEPPLDEARADGQPLALRRADAPSRAALAPTVPARGSAGGAPAAGATPPAPRTGAMLALSPTSASATRFRVDGELGRGGMGAVRDVRDRALRRQVAVKVMIDGPADQAAELRFLREFQILAQLEHPNIVPVYDAGTTNGAVSMTMRLIRGITLSAWLRDHALTTPANVDEFIELMVRVCDGLGYAHARGVIHRDLKPDNIMLGAHGEVYVMDWGCAGLVASMISRDGVEPVVIDPVMEQLDRPGIVLGTAAFMAPEQARGELARMDGRTDVYGLGAIIYVALTRQPPHPHRDPLAAIAAAQLGEVVHPRTLRPTSDLPDGLIAIAMRALEADPGRRFASIGDLREALVGLRRTGGVEAATFAPGELLCAETEPGEVAYLLESGEAVAYRSDGGARVVLGTLGPGDVVGETSLFTGRARATTVEAVTTVRALRVTRATIEREVASKAWAAAIVQALARRYGDTANQLASTRRQLARFTDLARIRALLRGARAGLPVEVAAAALGQPVDQVLDLVEFSGEFDVDAGGRLQPR